METLNEFANCIGFSSFQGAAKYFTFLGMITFVVFGIHRVQKPINQNKK